MRGPSFLQKIHAKMYAGSWKNPFFSDPKVKERAYERSRIAWYMALTGVSACALASLAFWYATQPRFAIHAINAEGMRSLPNAVLARTAYEEIKKCRAFGLPCWYTWNYEKAEIENQLKEKFPLEKSTLHIEGRNMFITVSESVTTIPLRIGSEVWFATQTGTLLKIATEEERNAGVLIPRDVYTEIDVTKAIDKGEVGAQVASADVFNTLNAYKEVFKEKGIIIDHLVLTRDAGKIIAVTKEGYSIFFSPFEAPREQGERAAKVLAERTPGSYIDIRFGDRVFVK